MVMASACLPALNQAVEIDGVAYWDGGYAANPPLIPLVQATAVPDLLVVQIIPTEAPALPRSAKDIERRLSQITFNASLLRDLDTLASLTDIGREPLPALFRKLDKTARLRLHRIAAEDHVPGPRHGQRDRSRLALSLQPARRRPCGGRRLARTGGSRR